VYMIVSNGATTSLRDGSVPSISTSGNTSLAAHELIQERDMQLIKVDTVDQLEDMFTKPLPYPLSLRH
jgi:hypothetical protein